jgi:hypothetical protein
MWLDAFTAKAGNMPKVSVPGVPAVPLSRKAIAQAGSAVPRARNTDKYQILPGVPEFQNGTPGTSWNTLIETMCIHESTPRKPSIHAGFAIFGTPGTLGTPQKTSKLENEDRVTDLVRKFMEDGLTLGDAQALATVSVPSRPADEWLALTAELEVMIGCYCAQTRLTSEAKAAILMASCRQSLASIPASLEWFQRELASMVKMTPKAATTAKRARE